MTRDITPTVAAIGELHLEGNIIPHLWFQHLTFENGKPDTIAILILAEVVYWYRPAYEKDEASGQVIGVRRKFRDDKLNRSYDRFAEQFGISKLQAKRAIDRLKQKGVVTTEFRTVRAANGMPVSNVLFLEPVPEMVKAISGLASDHPYFQVKRGLLPSEEVPQSKVKTYPENSGENEGTLRCANAHQGVPRPPALARPQRRLFVLKADPELLYEEITCPGKPKTTVVLDLVTPLQFYYQRRPSESDLRQVRKMVRLHWKHRGEEMTQEQLDMAALGALFWWRENRGGNPRGFHTFQMALVKATGDDPDNEWRRVYKMGILRAVDEKSMTDAEFSQRWGLQPWVIAELANELAEEGRITRSAA